MDRLTTTQQSELIPCVKCSEYDNCYGEMGCNAVYDALKKLKHYEDLETQLNETYGECNGLLEETIKCLVEHDGLDIDNPMKTRLLTDGSVDKWLRWKELDESGRLLELTCSESDLDLEVINELREYKNIGTIEEFREAMDKQKPKEPLDLEYFREDYSWMGKCPCCRACVTEIKKRC